MPSTRPKSTHETHREKFCIFCKGKNGDRNLTKNAKDYIRKYLIPDFDNFEDILPMKSCSTCRNVLSDINKNGKNATRAFKLTSEDYREMVSELRKFQKMSTDLQELGADFSCECFMCNLGAKKHNSFSKPVVGRPKIELPEVVETSKSRVGRPRKTSTPENMIRLDVSREERVNNLTKKLTPKTRKMTLLELAKQETDNSGDVIKGFDYIIYTKEMKTDLCSLSYTIL